MFFQVLEGVEIPNFLQFDKVVNDVSSLASPPGYNMVRTEIAFNGDMPDELIPRGEV